MEKIDIDLYDVVKWRVRQVLALIGALTLCILSFGILIYLNLDGNKYLPTLTIVLSLLLFALFAGSKKSKPVLMTTFEFQDDFLTIRTDSSSIDVQYRDISYIEYMKMTNGRHIDEIIGYKLYIDVRSGHRIRLDYDVMDKNNTAFEDTELYQVYVLLKKYYR